MRGIRAQSIKSGGGLARLVQAAVAPDPIAALRSIAIDPRETAEIRARAQRAIAALGDGEAKAAVPLAHPG